MRSFINDRWQEILIGLIALTLAMVTSTSDLLNLAQITGSERIIAVNTIYLEAAANDGLQDTLLLSELAALLEVIKSTDFGIELIVSVDVQIGEVLSSLTKAIEWAVVAAAAATIAAHALQFVNAVSDSLSPIFLIATLWAVVLWMIMRLLPCAQLLKSASRTIVETLCVLFLLSYLVMPYTINITGWLSQDLSQGLQTSTASTVQRFHEDTFQGGSLKTDLSYWTNSSNVRSAYDEVTSDLQDKVSALTRYALERVANLVIIGLFFPLTVIAILSFVLRRLAIIGLDTVEALAPKRAPASRPTASQP